MADEKESSAAVSSEQETTSQEQKKKSTFIYPEWDPVMQADDLGVRFDFACGARIQGDKEMKRRIRAMLIDMDSGTLMFSGEVKPGDHISCAKKYRIDYRLELYDEETHEKLYVHEMDFKYRDVLLQMPYEGAVGDSIAWFSCVERFQQDTGATVHLVMPPFMQKLFEKQYPDIRFETPDTARELRPYAMYYIGLFFGGDTDWQPGDFRYIGLAQQSGRLLKIKDETDIPPRVDLSAEREIKEPYVCIATQASSHSKHWNNPSGWRELIRELKLRGYRVLCIDKDRDVGEGDVWHSIPWGCEDYTGAMDLQKRVDLLHHADFFVGLNSGLSWLAWCCKIPVVVISGICLPYGEFSNPYIVQSRIACHGCWNDTRYAFKHDRFMWCPRFEEHDKERQFECTKSITPEMVLKVIDTIPGVRKRA